MKTHASVFAASLLLVSSIIAVAGEPVTIPIETHKAMKRGKKLNLVWQAPGFDGSKGFQLGKLANESEDEGSSAVHDFPTVLGRHIRAGSPYTLHLAVVGVRTSEKPGGASSARVDVEGRVVDQGGTLVAAFETRATATIGGSKRDNIRFAVNDIGFGIAKDLFSTGLPSNEKPSAVIVAAPVHENPPAVIAPTPADEKPQTVIATPPAETKPATIVTAPPVNEITPAAPPVEATAAISVAPIPSNPVVPAQAKEAVQPLAVEAVPPSSEPLQPKPSPGNPIAEALPASITGNMKRGSDLDGLWISPAYDRSSGFSLGEVRYLTDQRDDTVSAYLPDALAELAKKDAPCLLHLGITGLTSRTMIGRTAPVRMKVEGRLIAKDGTVVAAFRTTESVQTTDDISSSYRQVARKVVFAIGKDLR